MPTYPLTIEDLARHLRITNADENTYLTDLRAVATEHVGKLIDIDLTDGVTPVPEMAKHAIRLLVGHWYENREATTYGQESKPVPMAFDALILNIRGVLAS